MIDTVLASAVGLPRWVIIAAVGGILGGLGGLAGALLQNVVRIPHLSRLLLIVGVVVSIHVSQRIVIPAIITAAMNIELPKQIDDVTTLLRAEFNGRRYRYDFQLADTVPETPTASALKAALTGELCAHWAPRFAAENVSGAEYNYRLRTDTLSFSIEPGDCT